MKNSSSSKVTVIHNYSADKRDQVGDRFVELYSAMDEPANLHVSGLSSFAEDGLRGDEDEVVLAGGTLWSLDQNESLKRAVFQRVSGVRVPMLGSCFGAQVLATVNGARLRQLPEKRLGVHDIQIAQSVGGLVAGETVRVYESHRWGIVGATLPTSLRTLAISKDGVEAFLQLQGTARSGGVQFHPELSMPETPDALRLFAGVREEVLREAA